MESTLYNLGQQSLSWTENWMAYGSFEYKLDDEVMCVLQAVRLVYFPKTNNY
jgi:hypothetical protein